MIIDDTICAIATAHGVGGISIVRLSGQNAINIAKKIAKKDKFKIRYAHLCTLYDQESFVIDEAIVIYFKAPRSYTGEDVIEFQSHGGFVTAARIIDACLFYGARVAKGGEFTKRAVIHGKMDLSQAEAAAKLIESKSVEAAKILSAQLKGELQKFVDELRDKLVEILAFVEVNIDYAEEDLPKQLQDEIEKKLKYVYNTLQRSVQISESRAGIIEGFKVAIIGKPNVGKSSLLNSLLSYERAITSEIAGTTRDTIEENINIATHLVKIVDTAGVRQSGDKIEKIGIKRSIKAAKEADIIIALFDISEKFDENDNEILELLKEYKDSKEIIAVLNKKDLGKKFETRKLSEFKPLEISAKESADIVIKTLKNILDTKNSDQDILLITKRQNDATTKDSLAIKNSFSHLNEGELELFAYEINEAIGHVSSITKPFYRDEILDKMFASFCLGK